MEKKNIMEIERVLPEDFDGIFYFTNPTDEEFIGKWNSKEYHFAPMTTSPIIMLDESPLGIQQIRKKFAKDLAEREFGNTQKYKDFLKRERNIDGSPRAQGMSHAATYTIEDLAPTIQQCLIPLEKSKVSITDMPKVPLEKKLSRNDEGKLNMKPVKGGKGLEELKKDFEEGNE